MASLLSRLFGGGAEAGKDTAGDPVEYEGHTIIPAPRSDSGQWLTAGSITRTIEGEEQVHQFIRADKHTSRADAETFSIAKAKQIIDEQGDAIYRS